SCCYYVFFLYQLYLHTQHLHSFPTRRSSDLIVLREIARYIREEHMDWDGKEITHLEEIFEETEELVERDKENHMLRDDHSFFNYFEMRKAQFNLLQQMLPIVTRLPKKD